MFVETELKFAIKAEALAPLIQYLTQHMGQPLPAKLLMNRYYETDDQFLRRHDMGLRIRREDESYEMTLKTAGQTLGGLHQRPEYNVALQQDELELAKFPATVWPANCNVSELNLSLKPLFSSNFTRQIWQLTQAETEIELALDHGSIEANGQVQTILEVEIELKKGAIQPLFDVASALISNNHGAVRLSNCSKASRGYQLALNLPPKTLGDVQAPLLAKEISCEAAMQQILSHLLTEWQYLDRVRLTSSADLTRRSASLLAAIRQVILLFGGLLPRQASQAIRRGLTQLETDLITENTDALYCCFHPYWVGAQLTLTQWLVLQQWRGFLNANQPNRLANSYKSWSDTQLSRTAASIRLLAAKVCQSDPQAPARLQLQQSLRQQLTLMQLLSSYYSKDRVKNWLAVWLPGLDEHTGHAQITYQRARKLPDYWLLSNK